MKKTIYKILIVLLVFTVVNVHAENIDPTKESTITVKYSYGNTNFSNSNAYLYKIAELDEYGNLTYTEEFENIDSNLKNLTVSQLNALTVALDNEISQKDIPYLQTQVTNNEGLAEFNSLTTGVYLLKIDSVTNNDYQYKVVPTLISLPLYDEVNQEYKYDVSIMSKTEAKFIGNQTGDGNTTNPPNTVDLIMIYAAVFIISLLCIIGLVCYIKKIKKEGNKNEKENN